MLKKDLFMLAMKASEYKRRSFVISAFSVIQEAPDAWKRQPYPYRIVQTPAGVFFVDPNNEMQLTLIDDVKSGEAIYYAKEQVQITKGEVLNCSENITTTYGRLLFNYTVIINSFKNKIPYLNMKVSPKQIEDLIIGRLKDNPEKEEDRNDTDIYVSEYLDFSNAMFYLTGFTQICVPAATPKTITGAPGIAELKDKLLEENKDRLHDPAVIAKIDAELVAFDKAYMKGDLGEGFLINTGKSYDIVRKKLYGMHGAEVGLEEKVDVDLIKNSLSQGWDIEKFPAMNNSLRAGSFNRGAQTALGGESVKWLLRASSNMNVTLDDCGSNLGIVINVNASNIHKLVGFSVVTKGGSKLIETIEEANSYINKKIMLRSPMFCKLTKTDFCKTCVGTNLSASPTGLSVAISEFGSAVLSMFLKASHGKALKLSRMNYLTAIQ
jgi:hypothetical protein